MTIVMSKQLDDAGHAHLTRQTELSTLGIINQVIQQNDNFNTTMNIYLDLSTVFDAIIDKLLSYQLK